MSSLRRSAAVAGAAIVSSTLAACGATPSSAPAHRLHPIDVPATTSSSVASTLLARVESDALAQHWAHVVMRSPASASQPAATFTNVSGPASGLQGITIGLLTGSVVVIGSTAWVKGGSPSLNVLFGLPATAAGALANHWITVTPGDSQYAAISVGVTLSSVLSGARPSRAEAVHQARLAGRGVTAITGPLPALAELGTGSATLYVSTGAKPLPVEFVGEGSQGQVTTTFGSWGIAASIAAPPDPIPLSSLPGPSAIA